jgi:hypothetical protein
MPQGAHLELPAAQLAIVRGGLRPPPTEAECDGIRGAFGELAPDDFIEVRLADRCLQAGFPGKKPR